MHFPEGATCSPNKRIMSASGPEKVGPPDWDRFEWAVLREELDATSKLAGELGLWTIFGSVHQLTRRTGRTTASMSSPILGNW